MSSVGRWQSYVPAFVLLVGCAFIWQTHSQREMPLAAPLTSILPVIPGYQTVDQHIGDDERRIAGMTDYVARAYVRDSASQFQTLVSYYDRQGQGKTIHSPRNCLPGAGWEVLRGDVRPIDVDGSRYVVNHYMIKNGVQTAVVYYWYQGRGRVVSSEYAVKWNLLRDAALLGHTEEALVRVVVPIPVSLARLDSTSAARYVAGADSLGDDIARQLIRDVKRVLPRVTETSAGD
jgi:EpsI family protein